MKRTELGRGKGLDRGSGPKRKTGLRAPSRPLSPSKGLARVPVGVEREKAGGSPDPKRSEGLSRIPKRPRVEFRARVPANRGTCFRCARTARHWHHVLTQEQIRTFVRGLRLPPDDHDAVLRELLGDERNLVRVCVVHHVAVEDGSVALLAEDLSAAEGFAAELGPEWLERLRRRYPAAGKRRVDKEERDGPDHG